LSTPFQPVPENEPVAPPPAPQPGILPREHPEFGFLDLVLVLFGGLLLMVASQIAALLVARALPRFANLPLTELAKQPLILIPAQVVFYILLVAFIHVLLYARHMRGLADLIPFARPRHWAALAGVGIALAFAIQLLGEKLPMPKQLPIDEYFKERSVAFIMLGFGVLIAPFVEELIFRGLLYPVLNRWTGATISVTITSLLFALLHAGQLAFSWAPLLSLFLVGVVLTLVRARYQSVLASTLVHMAYNATLFGMLLAATGGFRHMDALSR
jgi:membrane protease YdiL (CAAX protease family)